MLHLGISAFVSQESLDAEAEVNKLDGSAVSLQWGIHFGALEEEIEKSFASYTQFRGFMSRCTIPALWM